MGPNPHTPSSGDRDPDLQMPEELERPRHPAVREVPVPSEDTIEYIMSDETRAEIYGPARRSLTFDWGATTHPGKVREHNEDHYLIYRRRRQQEVLGTNLLAGRDWNLVDDVYVLAVADGLGGHSYGELASHLVLEMGLGGVPGSWLTRLADLDINDVAAAAMTGAEMVHRRLIEESYRDARFRGMASTLTALVVQGSQVVLIHLGDSRAYLWHDGRLSQLSRDHTLAQDILNRQPQLPGQRTSRLANVLTNCLGGEDGPIRVETGRLQWSPGDCLLLCTDGLSDLVSFEDLEREIGRERPAAESCQVLLQQALEAGGRDNVTLALLRHLGPS
ncbi:MAG: protein phosphatase 2C domain-containing protein [Pirellulales bacterium]